MKCWSSTVFFSACNCHGHSTDCYYDSNVEYQRRSLNKQNIREGGGVCINCEVRHQLNWSGWVLTRREHAAGFVLKASPRELEAIKRLFWGHFSTFGHTKALLAGCNLGVLREVDWDVFIWRPLSMSSMSVCLNQEESSWLLSNLRWKGSKVGGPGRCQLQYWP